MICFSSFIIVLARGNVLHRLHMIRRKDSGHMDLYGHLCESPDGNLQRSSELKEDEKAGNISLGILP